MANAQAEFAAWRLARRTRWEARGLGLVAVGLAAAALLVAGVCPRSPARVREAC